MSQLPSWGVARVVSDPVNICVQSRKSSRGRLERAHPTALSGQSSKAQLRAFSPGQHWGELESPQCFSDGDEGCAGVPAVVCSYHCPHSKPKRAVPEKSDPQMEVAK